MKKRKTTKRSIKPPQAQTVEQSLVTMMATIAEGPDDRRRRFVLALVMALDHLSADDMDKIEPTLNATIGKASIAKTFRLLYRSAGGGRP